LRGGFRGTEAPFPPSQVTLGQPLDLADRPPLPAGHEVRRSRKAVAVPMGDAGGLWAPRPWRERQFRWSLGHRAPTDDPVRLLPPLGPKLRARATRAVPHSLPATGAAPARLTPFLCCSATGRFRSGRLEEPLAKYLMGTPRWIPCPATDPKAGVTFPDRSASSSRAPGRSSMRV
jgi:hypothetical protein